MTTQNEFFNALRNIQSRAQRIPLPDVLVLKAWEHLSESVSLADHAPEIEQRSVAQQYLCVYQNGLSNPDFDTDLTGWTEVTDVNVTGTTAWNRTQGQVFSEQGSIGGLKIDIAASAAAGGIGQFQQITGVSAGEIWNLEMYIKGVDFNNASARLLLQWRDSGNGGTGSAQTTSTDVSGDWVQLKLENQTAPASTAKLEFGMYLDPSSSGADATAYYGKPRAELGATTISARSRRIICGEWVCRT